jgi:tetratricopeptide (TPR) repeat protein
MRTLGTRRQFVEHRLAKQAFRFLLIAMTISTGCRSIVQHKSNTELVAARQLSLRGADALQRSRPQDAEMLFSEALRRSPLDERAHWGYASTLWNRGDRQRAIEHMREALRLSGTNPEYAIRLGEMSLEMGDRASAADAAKTVLSANRNHAKAWALLGDTHRSEKDWPAALVCYHRALLIQSDYPRVQLSVAEIYRDTGRPQRSLAALDRMTDLRSTASTDPEVLLIRGQALADLNRNEEAAEALAMASERMPSHRIDKQIELVHAQHRIGELVPARMTLGKLLALNSGHPDVTRLQSMLDLSFAHLSDPASTLRSSKNVLVDTQIPTAVGSQNSNSGLDGPAGSRLASPMIMPDASNWVRR